MIILCQLTMPLCYRVLIIVHNLNNQVNIYHNTGREEPVKSGLNRVWINNQMAV